MRASSRTTLASSFSPLPNKLEKGCCGSDRPLEVSIDRHHLRATAQLTGAPDCGNGWKCRSGLQWAPPALHASDSWQWMADPGLGQSDALACTFLTHLEGLQAGVPGLNHGSCSALEKRSETSVAEGLGAAAFRPILSLDCATCPPRP